MSLTLKDVGSSPVEFMYFFHFFSRFASMFVFFLDSVHTWVCLFEFGMRLCVTNTAPLINSIILHVINSLHAVKFLRLLLSSADFK